MVSGKREPLVAPDLLMTVNDGAPWLLMVSGGSDSVALAYLAIAAVQMNPHPLAIFHGNHHLRADESDGDAQFVRSLAENLGVPFYGADLDVDAACAAGENLEAAARRLRYKAAARQLDQWTRELNISPQEGRLLVAHTLDDRIENFFMRALVGTGPGGFRSMMPRQARLWRPLLDVTRQALRDYIETRALAGIAVRDENGALWREDSTNADTGRLRGFVRHQLIPLAKTRSPQLELVLRRTMDLIGDEDDYMADQALAVAHEHLRWIYEETSSLEPPAAGFSLDASFGDVARVLARRVVHEALARMAGADARIDASAVEAVLNGYDQGKPRSGYVVNIQGNLAVSANRLGVRVEPMSCFRARRKGNS